MSPLYIITRKLNQVPYVDDSKSILNYMPVSSVHDNGKVLFEGTAVKKRLVQTQYGFRSKGEREAAEEALARFQKSGSWGTTTSAIAALDRIERSMVSPLIRDPYDLSVHVRRLIKAEDDGVQLHVRHLTTNIVSGGRCYISDSPGVPSDSALRGFGGQQMREAMPTAPHSNLTQWFGELRQFGDLAKPSLKFSKDDWTRPGIVGEIKRWQKGGANTGSAYLASQFGWLPFVGEIISAIEAVANSAKYVDQYLRDSGKLVHRTRTKVLSQTVHTYESTLFGGTNAGNFTDVHVAVDGWKYNIGWTKAYASASYRCRFKSTLSASVRQTSGGLWEYFAMDPSGNLAELQSKAQKAKLLLGDPLTSLSTIWELAPWSWLVDWKFNFGSFLSYQESVATDSLASRRTFTVYEQVGNLLTHFTPYSSIYGALPLSGPNIATSSLKRQVRLAGSPYDMGIDPSGFSPQKWFILGALGLTKAPGLLR